jgi:hypothetical protein
MIDMPKVIKLMTDYGCSPLWWQDDIGNIDPGSLPLQSETRERLKAWAAVYDSWLNWADPLASPEPPSAEVTAFEVEGVLLWMQLRKELAGQFEVVYFRHGTVFDNPEQLEGSHE